MTTRERVGATGRTLAAVAALRSILLGASVALGIATLARLTSSALLLSVAMSAGIGTIAAIVVYRRIRGPGFSAPSVALWLEERIPALGYSLVTALEGGPPQLEHSVARVDWAEVIRTAARKALVLPLLAATGASILFFASGTLAPSIARLALDRVVGTRAIPGTLNVTVTVSPPAYTRRQTTVVRNPDVITALTGSSLRLQSPGRSSVTLSVAGTDSASISGDSWRVGTRPVALRVTSGNDSRLIAIDPLPDSAPAVTLLSPARDTVLATPSGAFTLGATLHDDLGIRRAAFEYIVSAGSGETFTFVSGVAGARDIDGATSGRIEAEFRLGGLNLKPGDFVHLRAVALDLRDDTLAARGASETRTIRIARAGELDSVSVEAAAPPEADKAVLSQRMLINLAEALVRRRPRLAREVFGDESRAIGRDQARLRKQVSDIVFSRLGDDPSGEHFHGDGHEHEGQTLRPALTPEELLKAAENATIAAAGKALDFEGDETPVVNVNRPLLEAYNHMWDATRDLNQASPERALPAMYRALAAIQRARAAERLYLRSRPPRAVVDVERVRLQGRDRGSSSPRQPRAVTVLEGRGALARLTRAAQLADTDPQAASDSLLLLRVDLLGVIPPDAARAASEVANEWRAGRSADDKLAVLRRAIAPAARQTDSLPRWQGVR